MVKKLCCIFLFVLSYSTTAVAANYPSESLRSSLTDSTGVEKLKQKGTQFNTSTLPEPEEESDTEEEESTAFDDEHG